jgi:Nucleotidyl transferase AbiEii toxin, Type IV TA system
LSVHEAGRPARRVRVDAYLDGRLFAPVRIDLVTVRDEITETERLPLPGYLAFAGIPRRQVDVVDRRQHFAEKLHAFTRVHDGRPSSRVHDLIDMVLLIDHGLDPSPTLLEVVARVFEIRRTQPVPDEIPDAPSGWALAYAELAAEREISARTVDEAVATLRAFWAAVRGA